jgi:hypothetical protein
VTCLDVLPLKTADNVCTPDDRLEIVIAALPPVSVLDPRTAKPS